MEFGTHHETLQAVVALMEKHLGIVMSKHSHDEVGDYYLWSSDLGKKGGVTPYGIDVRSTKYWDSDTKKFHLGHSKWEGYTFVISISDELRYETSRIRELITNGDLKAEELPPPRSRMS